jgi:hypothetical protein
MNVRMDFHSVWYTHRKDLESNARDSRPQRALQQTRSNTKRGSVLSDPECPFMLFSIVHLGPFSALL